MTRRLLRDRWGARHRQCRADDARKRRSRWRRWRSASASAMARLRTEASRRDRQGYAAVGLHARAAGADRRVHHDGHGRRAGRATADVPAIAMLTRSLRADIGNGHLGLAQPLHRPTAAKLFGRDGYKLSDDLETKIEAALDKGPSNRAGPAELGRAKRLDDAGGRYIEFVEAELSLKGLRLERAARRRRLRARRRLQGQRRPYSGRLGAEVFSVGVSPGAALNINPAIAAPSSPEQMRQEVLARPRRYRHRARRRRRSADRHRRARRSSTATHR